MWYTQQEGTGITNLVEHSQFFVPMFLLKLKKKKPCSYKVFYFKKHKHEIICIEVSFPHKDLEGKKKKKKS